jgi:hypothetical protein
MDDNERARWADACDREIGRLQSQFIELGDGETGRQVQTCKCGGVGISATGSVAFGDGCASIAPPDSGPLTKAECAELANEMIRRWEAFKAETAK